MAVRGGSRTSSVSEFGLRARDARTNFPSTLEENFWLNYLVFAEARAARHKGAGKAPVFVSMLLQEDVVMRNYDFASLFRSTVGFDRLFDMLDNSVRPDWPPYNIERRDENQYRISMALAGFGPDEIEVIQQGATLLVTGQKKTEQSHQEVFHNGLAFRNFKQTFSLADHMKVTSANLENGLLSIELMREVPEQLRPRRIEIGSRSATIEAQNNQPKMVGRNPEAQSQAA
jgi:molecular chaperone IbpA